MTRDLLTPREREVLALISRGKTASEIAAALKIAKEAVDADVKSAAHKLGAVNTSHQQSKGTRKDKLRSPGQRNR
jgi:LuxR family quorum sensing-dependent transcriptional regulator